MKEEKSQKILLIGASGKLGSEIKNSSLSSQIISLSRNHLDLTNKESIDLVLNEIKPKFIINCAAIARRKICEKNPNIAIQVNIIGTANLTNSILDFIKKNQIIPRILHFSTDAVYSQNGGNHLENFPTIPKCNYGWTKLASECSLRILPNHLIIRTRFFDPLNIPFDDAANDIYTSSLEIKKLVNISNKLLFSDYIGIVNVGGIRQSDYNLYKKYKHNIKKTSRQIIEKASGLNFYDDYSLCIDKLDKLI